MKANAFRTSPFPRCSRLRVADVGPVDLLAALYADLSTARRRLSIVVAEYRCASTSAPTWASVARARLAYAVVVEGCRALDRVAELPALAPQFAGQASQVGADLEAQADAVVSAAARLAGVLRGRGTGFRGDRCAFRGDLTAPPVLACLAGLGPNETDETDESLLLAAENVSLALSLAARLVLVLSRLRARRCRVRQLAVICRRRTVRWGVRAASLPLATGLAHGWPIAPTHPTAVAVLLLVALVMSAGRPARPRVVGPIGFVAALLGDLAGVVASVALPHLVLLVLALADAVNAVTVGGAHPTEHDESGYVGLSGRRTRPRRARRDQ